MRCLIILQEQQSKHSDYESLLKDGKDTAHAQQKGSDSSFSFYKSDEIDPFMYLYDNQMDKSLVTIVLSFNNSRMNTYCIA